MKLKSLPNDQVKRAEQPEGVVKKLPQILADFETVTGRKFQQFFCPVLFSDENVLLSEAYVINRDFPDTPRVTTVQRADVDGFYGSNFESEFVDIVYRKTGSMETALIDKDRSLRLRPEIQKNGKKVGYYVPKNETIPEEFTPIEFTDGKQTIPLILKIHYSELFSENSKWEIAINKDMRLSAVVSLIKSSHLTLFHLLGYHYALSAGGHFVGRNILGEFFLKNKGKDRSAIRAEGIKYFKEFIHMVRPVESNTMNLKGTLIDNIVFVCRQKNWYWGLIVFVPITGMLHAVMLPVFDFHEGAARYVRFLNDENEFIEGHFCKIATDQWVMDPKLFPMNWLKKDVSIRLD